ncbi:MAG: hypothetical protein ACT4N4_14405 [Rhodospirillales bacterium]
MLFPQVKPVGFERSTLNRRLAFARELLVRVDEQILDEAVETRRQRDIPRCRRRRR